MSKKLIKKILYFHLYPILFLYRLILIKQYQRQIEESNRNSKLLFLAQDQFGSIIYHVAYALLWQKNRGDITLVVFSPFHQDILNIVRLYNKNIKIITPKYNFLNLKLIKMFKIVGIIYEICFLPLFKEMSFQFPNYISLFGVFPKNRINYISNFDSILDCDFANNGIKKHYIKGRNSIDSFHSNKLDLHKLIYNNQHLSLIKDFKNEFLTNLNIPDNYVVININQKNNKDWSQSNNNRAVLSTETSNKIINFLLKLGYYVVLHGRSEQHSFPKRKNLFNYAHSKLVSVKNDVLLIYYAKAFFTTKSGVENLALLSNTPTFGFNYTDLCSMSPLKKFRFVPKHILNNNKRLKWEDYLSFEGFYERNLDPHIAKNIRFEDNSFEELIPSIKEFLKLIDKPEKDWENNSNIQKFYKASLKEYHLDLYSIKGLPTEYYLKNETG